MKRLATLLFIAALAAALWQIARPRIQEGVDHLFSLGESLPPAHATPLPETTADRGSPPLPQGVQPSMAPEESPSQEPVEILIARIVHERYPDPPIRPLAEVTDGWSRIPAPVLPAEATVTNRLELQFREQGSVLSASLIQPTGLVQPLSVENGLLLVASLGDRRLQARLPLENTDLIRRIEVNHQSFSGEVTRKITAMREDDTRALTRWPALAAEMQRSEDWDQPSEGAIKILRERMLADAVPAGAVPADAAFRFYFNGEEKVDHPAFQGSYEVVVVYYETETPFGMLPHRLKCLLQHGRLAGWIDPL